MHLTCLGRTTLLILVPVLAHLAQANTNPPSGNDAASRAKAAAEYSRMPMNFEWNQGQTDPQVKALARGRGYGLFLTNTESVLKLAPGNQKGAVLRWKLMGSNPTPNVQPVDRLPASVNIFIGNDPSKWRKDVPVFGKVKYDTVYPGIDLIYYGTQEELEYDFVVAPGADPKAIRFAISGADKLRLDARGDLVMKTHFGEVRHHKPVIYQEVDGVRRGVDGHFVVEGKQVAFAVGAYDRSRTLVIDPSLDFLTYTGGSNNDMGKAVGVDNLGQTYYGGATASTDFPINSNAPYPTSGGGTTDAFFSVLLFQTPHGSKFFISTYFGGTGADAVTSMILAPGSAGSTIPEIYVGGTTSSTDLPTVNPVQTQNAGGQDGFVAHLHFPNQILFASYLGGSGNDSINGIGVDSLGGIVVAGSTTSTNFPVKNARQPNNAGGADAFVTRYNGSETDYIFSTYLGGAGSEIANGLAVDGLGINATNNIYIAGFTTSTSFGAANRLSLQKGIVANGSKAFVTVMSSDGSQALVSKQFGGSGTSSATGVAIDNSKNIFVTGFTNSTDFPVANAIQAAIGGKSDAFLTKFKSDGSMLFSTYLGGSGADQANAVAVDSSGNAYVGGVTTSTNFPTKNPVQASNGGGAGDGFVTEILANGSAIGYSTYLGGSGVDVITAISVGGAGNAVVTGYTSSTNLPVTSGVLQPHLKGGYDAFAGRIYTQP